MSSTTLAYEPGDEDAAENADEIEVTVERDEYGVPHIYARDAPDRTAVFYGYGYATARDRLYQLELYRRYYHGTVAEVLGEEWVDFDREARINHSSSVPLEEQIQTQLDADHRAVLQAYADGINRHVDAVRSGESDRPGFHAGFVENDFEPDRWDAVDVAGVFVATMAFFSGVNLETTNAMVLAGLEETYDEETAWDLFEDLQWGNDPDAPTSGDEPNPGFAPPFSESGIYAADGETDTRQRLSDGVTGGTTNRVTGGEFRLTSDPDGTFDRQQRRLETLVDGARELGIPTTVGSNALAVHGDITESGDHLLMGGPQMEFSTPSVMYEVSLHGPDFDVAGITVTGYPAIMFGHNGDGSFTSTAGIDKSIQTFVESIREPDDGNRNGTAEYEFRGDWYEMEADEETIAVADGEDVSHTVRRTRHGAVTDYDPETGEAIAQTRGFDGRDMNCLRAYYEAQFADDVEEYGAAAKQCDYALNFIWAGEGGIGYFHLGRYPDFEAVPWDTRLPADGTKHELTDDDFLRAADDEVPYSINPPVGYSAQWNNKPAPDWDNGDRSYSWGVDHRVQRFINLVEHELETSGSVGYENLKEMVYDTSFVDLRAIRYKSFLLDALADADLSQTEGEAKDALEAWDDYQQASGDDYMGQYPVGFTVFDEFFPRLIERTFAPTFGDQFELATTFLDDSYGRSTLMRALYPDETTLDVATDYFDGDRDGIFREAFRDAVAALEDEYGSDVSEWRASVADGGLDNVVLFGMPVGIGDAGELPFLNRGTENHFVRIGDDAVRAENVLPPGNSGYLSPDGEPETNYDDQLELFLDFEYKDLLFDDDEIAAAAVDERVLGSDQRTEGKGTDEEDGKTPAEDGPDDTDESNDAADGDEPDESDDAADGGDDGNDRDDDGADDGLPGFGAGGALVGIGAAGLFRWLTSESDTEFEPESES